MAEKFEDLKSSSESSNTSQDIYRNDESSDSISTSVDDLSDIKAALQRGSDLAAKFKNESYLPVLIFGARASGKTSLLTSLFQFIHISRSANATVSLDLQVLPSGSSAWQAMRKHATVLFERKVYEFMDKKAADASMEELPFFVPVNLQPNSGNDQNFAFLEGRGEWYQPDDYADSPHRPFKGEIEGFLRSFNAPLCVIYVAPFATEGYGHNGEKEAPNSEELKRRDLGLFGAMSTYRDIRKANFQHDHHLFLFTKWDVRCDGLSDKEFLYPDDNLLEEEIRERYPISFSRFQAMHFGVPNSNKVAAHYCSGIIDGKSVLPPATDDQPKIDIFPRKLWNWLYYSAQKIPLYSDMQPKKPNYLDKLLSWLRG